MNRYDRGDRVVLGIELVDQNGEPVDEATLTLTVRSPTDHRDEGQVIAVAGLTHPAEGSYEYALDLDERGRYDYRWETAGVVPLAEERTIYSRPGAFAPVGS